MTRREGREGLLRAEERRAPLLAPLRTLLVRLTGIRRHVRDQVLPEVGIVAVGDLLLQPPAIAGQLAELRRQRVKARVERRRNLVDPWCS